jgi:alkylhydroperoxidase family enzyme
MLLNNDAELAAKAWGEISESQTAELSSWPNSNAFDERQKAALALTEQFVIDVTGVLAGPLAASAGAPPANSLACGVSAGPKPFN